LSGFECFISRHYKKENGGRGGGGGGGGGVLTFHCVLPEEGHRLYFTYSSIDVSITLSTKVK